MELLYCDRCGFRISDQDLAQGKAVRLDDKVFCPKCAPPPLPNVGNVGKRQSGPKLSAAEEPPRRASLTNVPAHPAHERRHGPTGGAHPPTKPDQSANTGMIIAGAVGAGALLLAIIMLGGDSGTKTKPGSEKHTQTETSSVADTPPARTSTGSSNPAVGSAPTPSPTHAAPVYETPSQTPSPMLAPPSKNDPETIASDAFDKVRAFAGLAADDTDGRIQRLDEFISKYSESIAAARARRMREELKSPAPQPAPPPADEYADFTNYALAKNGATARAEKNAQVLIDGNATKYDDFHGFAESLWNAPMFVVLKEPTELNCIRFLFWDHNPRFYRYKLDVCEDAAEQNWTSIVDRTSEDNRCQSWQVLKFAPRKVKVIRVTGTYNTDNQAYHLVELQAFRLPDALIGPVVGVPDTKLQANDRTLYSETFDGPEVEYLGGGECVDGPPGSNGKVLLLKGTPTWSKGGLYNWAHKVSDQKNLKFTFLDNTHVRFRYFNQNARDFRIAIVVDGDKRQYEHLLDPNQKNTWLNVDIPLNEIVQVDTSAPLKPGSAVDEIRFHTWGEGDIVLYVDDLWIGVPGAPAKAGDGGAPGKTGDSGATVAVPKTATYNEFLYAYHTALRLRDRAGAEALLKASKFPSSEKELAQDAKAAEWLAQLDALQLKGLEKLKELDSFELKSEKGNALSIGKKAKYRVDEVKNGIVYATGDGARVPIAIEALQPDTREQLIQLALDNDATGAQLRAFLALLKVDAKAPAYQFTAARSAIDKAKAAGAPDWAVLKRLLDVVVVKSQEADKAEAELARQDAAAVREWGSINQLCETGKWDQVPAALGTFKEKYGATAFGSRKAEEIKSLLGKAADAPFTKGLVGYWKFDEGKGNATVDSSGNDNAGRIVGAEWAQGRTGSGLSFNGSEDFVEVPDRPNLRITEALTVSLWFKNMGKTRNWGRLVSKGWHKADNPWIAYGLIMNDADEGQQKVKFQASLAGDKQSEIYSQSTFPVNGAWHQIVGVFDGPKAKIAIYIDGVKEGESGVNNTTIAATPSALRFGDDPMTKEKHKCVLDEIRIYNRALSDAEVKALFNLSK